jgi:hypothetical protein
VEAGLTDDEAVPLIEGMMTRDPNPSDEVESALSAARGERGERHPKWPERNRGMIEEIAQAGPRLNELRALSPVQWADDSRHSEEIIDALFPGNPLLCVGRDAKSFVTKAREEWRGVLAERALIVPSPMSKLTGVTKDGQSGSHRTNDNTGQRRFLVIECDFKEKDGRGNDTPDGPMLRRLGENGITVADVCAAAIHHLSQCGYPLAVVVHSGGKSLHAFFYVQGQPEEGLRQFMRYAVSIGADAATWTRCQLVRMPDGTRDNGNRQTVHYFNPEVIR